MEILILALMAGGLWLNLVGLGLLVFLRHKDYAVARVAALPAVCLLLFFVEHFVGLGSLVTLLPLTTIGSLWLVWKQRRVLRENWPVEAFFLLGFAYCLAWRWAFPDLDLAAEKIPDLVFIQDYATGEMLPATDRWLPPYKASFYYGLQHYSAGLLCRWFSIPAALSYQFSYAVIVGLAVCAAGMAAFRLCGGKARSWLVPVAFLVGGNGVIISLPFLLKQAPDLWMSSRFLGMGTTAEDWNTTGRLISTSFDPPIGREALELPMDTFSYAVQLGEYHPPLFGFLLLSLSCLLLVTLELGGPGRVRKVTHALLGGTIPLCLVGNAWIAPLQVLLVACWALYRALRGERSHWPMLALGAAVFSLLSYPHLLEFTTQAVTSHSALRLTPPELRSGWGGWLLMFWPVLGILALGLLNRERRGFNLFLLILWGGLMVFSELVYNDDGFAGTWDRYNSSLKWWPWIYAGVIITSGASNLASSTRFCRWGTVCLLLATCTFGKMLWTVWHGAGPSSAERFQGTSWLLNTPELKQLVTTLSDLPDGVALESGHASINNETGVLSVFANKACHLGWPVHEQVLWRGVTSQVGVRLKETVEFYAGTMPEPVLWLDRNNIRYVLWLERDHKLNPAVFPRLRKTLAGHFRWHGFRLAGQDLEIGFWERFEVGQPSLSPAVSPVPTTPLR